MEDLDAELLAVTDGQKRNDRSNSRDRSDSDGAEFEGIADSDNGDDDDDDNRRSDYDEEEDEDDEYGLDDEDDEDYGSKSASKKKARPAKVKKRATKPKKPRAPKKSSFDRRNSSKRKPEMSSDDDDEEQFEFEYDQYGYGDSADRDRLAKKSEVDRELILEERIERRGRELLLWKKKREMMARESRDREDDASKRTARSSGRTKQSSKSDALQALAEDKRKKSSRAIDINVSDADSEPDRPSRRDADRQRKRPKEEIKPEAELMRDDEGPEMKYADIVKTDKGGERLTSPLFLRRSTLAHLSQQPFFERAVMGLFARVRAPHSHETYLLCRIAGVKKGKVYDLQQNMKSNLMLILQIGESKKSFELRMTSDSHPLEEEFQKYRNLVVRSGSDMPRREEVEKLLRRSKEIVIDRKAAPTEEEQKNHMANMEIVYPARVNWTQKRTEAGTALDIKKQDLSRAREDGKDGLVDRLSQEVEDLEMRLAEIRENENKYVLKAAEPNTSVFQSLARRNIEMNSNTERLKVSRVNHEAGIEDADPFARLDTSGQSYFSIKTTKNEPEVQTEDVKDSDKLEAGDWRHWIKTWDPVAKKRKISEKAIDPLFGSALMGLDIFNAKREDIDAKPFIPTGVDAMYANYIKKEEKIPQGTKVISLDEWSSERGQA